MQSPSLPALTRTSAQGRRWGRKRANADYSPVAASPGTRSCRTLAYRATRLSIIESIRPRTSATDRAFDFARGESLVAKKSGRLAFAARGNASGALLPGLARLDGVDAPDGL